MQTRIARAWTIGCLRQALIAAAAGIVLLVGLAGLVALALSLPISPDQRSGIIGFGLFGLIGLLILTIILWGIVTDFRRGSRLANIFSALGLERRGGFMAGRGFHGAYQGRQADVYISRGPVFDLYLEAGTQTRLTASLHDVVAGHAQVGRDGIIPDLNLSAADERYARSLLADPQALDALRELLRPGSPVEMRFFRIQPGAVQLQVRYITLQQINPENIVRWLEALLVLARAAETLPEPAAPLAPSRLEIYNRTRRGAYLLPVLGVIALILVAALAVWAGSFYLILQAVK